MSPAGAEQASAWLAVVPMAAALASALAAALARTLLAMCFTVCAAGACAAAAVLALGAGGGGLALAAIAAVWVPLLLLAGLSLGGRVAKSNRKRRPWVSAAFTAVLAATLIWASRGLSSDLAPVVSDARGGGGVWLAAMVLVAASGCAALLGYGERGVLERLRSGGER